jgi:hypothetical protein
MAGRAGFSVCGRLSGTAYWLAAEALAGLHRPSGQKFRTVRTATAVESIWL